MVGDRCRGVGGPSRTSGRRSSPGGRDDRIDSSGTFDRRVVGRAGEPSSVIVVLRHPRREIHVEGTRRVHALLAELELSREAHLVIRNGTLVPGDALLEADDTIEIRPVVSGG